MAQENGNGTEDLRGAIDLSKAAQKQPTHGAVNVTAIINRLDDEGRYPLTQKARGNMGPARSDYLDAQQLIEAIREAVREELAAHGFTLE